MRVIDLIKSAGLDAQVSVKPTQLGFDQDVEICFAHLAKLNDYAQAAGVFLWLDMESSKYVDGTIALATNGCARARPRSASPSRPTCTGREKDLDPLVAIGSAIRMVKGAYSGSRLRRRDAEEVRAWTKTISKLAARLLQPDANASQARFSISPRTTSDCSSGCSR